MAPKETGSNHGQLTLEVIIIQEITTGIMTLELTGGSQCAEFTLRVFTLQNNVKC